MCGITGAFVTASPKPRLDLGSVIARMMGTLEHRGPDDSGVFLGDGIGLGHLRLSIIDLSPGGHQPMATPDGLLQIIFNGEIYNFKEVRAELVDKGYHFRSHSDTEVILHGYSLWGTGVFSRLRGMFAIAIFDARNDQLILARDRIGKKPLFYAWHEGVLLFGSEIKAILAFPNFRREADLGAIHHYLSIQYVPSPLSAFKGVHKLPQATHMVIARDGGSRIEPYWQLPSPRATQNRSPAELNEELLVLLDDSVRLRMIADVPLGAFLSGGVDSSAVVAMMARHSSGRVKTFCIGFEEEAFDERRFARMVAERYDTDHHEMVVRPVAMEVLPRLIWHYNEPFADPSAVPTYYVSEIARRQVKVVLNGDGGDENFLGYPRYQRCLESEWIRRIPRLLRRLASSASAAIPARLESRRIARSARHRLALIGEKDALRYSPYLFSFLEQDKVASYGEQMAPYLASSTIDLLEPFFEQSPSFVGGAAWADIHTYLPDDLLVKVDIASMAHSLEARAPLLDHQLMEWAARIPPSQKIVGGESKSIFKSALEKLLPHEVLYRPKMGFGVPIDHWFRAEMKEFAYATLLGSAARQRGLFKERYVRSLLDEHSAGTRAHHSRLWSMLMLELWFQMWVDPAEVPLTCPQPMAGLG